MGSGESEPFLQAVADLRDRLTRSELLWACALFQLLASGLLVWGRKRRPLRIAGVVICVPALLLALEVLWFGPARQPRAVILKGAQVLAEPLAGLEPVLRLKPGVTVSLLGRVNEWSRIEVGDRSGYVPAASLGVIE